MQTDYDHIRNEWADCAVNGMQWLKNVADGISKPEDGVAEMAENIRRIRGLYPHYEQQPDGTITQVDPSDTGLTA